MKIVNHTIKELRLKYSGKIDPLDLEILISFVIKKSREFILAHPDKSVTGNQQLAIGKLIKRRIANEPIAYITGHKEFYGLDFKVNKHTLIPRPETELIVDLLRSMLRNKLHNNIAVVDIGTGSGNILISIAKNLKVEKYFGIDISKDALKMAKKNAKNHKVYKKIEFLEGNLLSPISKKLMKIKANKLILIANLPYLSEEIYKSSPDNVKKYEPKTALYSDNYGLSHYEELLKQISSLATHYGTQVTILLEISPEQKEKLEKIIKKLLPNFKIKFHKDLAHKWRVCEINS